MELVLVFFALVAGLAAGWVFGQKDVSRMREKLAGTEKELTAIQVQAAEREKSATNEKKFYDQSLEAMKDEFAKLAPAALKGNRDEFCKDP